MSATPVAAGRTPRYLVAAELGLLAVTIATVLGFGRVFEDASFLPPMLIVATVAHGLTFVARRRGLAVPTTALIAIPAFVLMASWLFFFDTTLAGIPTSSTLGAAQDAFSQSWATFQTIVAPAPAQTGFVLTSCIALYFTVFLADWAAFRLWSAYEAVVPAATLFIFCSLFGSGGQRIVATGLFAAAVLAFLLLHRTARRETSAGWLTTDVDRGSDAIVRAGGAVALMAVVVGVVIGPFVPGAQSPSLVPWHGEGGNRTRTVISPLVNIQDRLLNQSTVEMFTVEADAPAYWRLTALDEFGGDAWKSGGNYNEASGDLRSERPPEAVSTELRQTFHITDFGALWAPAAYVPARLEEASTDLRFQAESATLIVNQERQASDDMDYTIVSQLPTFEKDKLDAVTFDELPDDIVSRYTELPSDFSASVTAEARRQTDAAGSPYAKARALEDYFSGPNSEFTYDLKVPAGHSESAIESFLADKVGYCEQFAGTYAAMARAIGLPARVAVGFTPGVQDPTDKRLWRVTGRFAHAWPEIYLGPKYGWVPFEPTPNRGAPNAEGWTGRERAQAEATGSGATAGTIPAGVTEPTTPTPTQPDDPAGRNPDINVGPPPAPTTTAAPEEPPTPGETAIKVATGTGISLVLLAAVAGAYLALLLALKAALWRRRREAARDASAAVQVAWRECLDALTLFGLRPLPTETAEEFALRAAPYLEHLAAPVLGLATDVEAASFAPNVLPAEVAARAGTVAAEVHTFAHERATAARQWQDRFDPRPVVAGYLHKE